MSSTTAPTATQLPPARPPMLSLQQLQANIKERMEKRGGLGIHAMAVTFKNMDDDGSLCLKPCSVLLTLIFCFVFQKTRQQEVESL